LKQQLASGVIVAEEIVSRWVGDIIGAAGALRGGRMEWNLVAAWA
jgi:hypothetical protein